MPFTFSHPAVIIPIREKWKSLFDFTALIIGSMAPDFEYFIRFKPVGSSGHTLMGFIYLNLPLCIIAAYIFHYVVKKPLILHLPKAINIWYDYLLVEDWELHSVRDFYKFTYSALIGMGSHVLWDSFSHVSGIFVQIIPLLSKKVCFLTLEIPLYKFVQHGSTLLGLVVIFFYVVSQRSQEQVNVCEVSVEAKLMYWFQIFLIGLGVVWYNSFSKIDGLNVNYIGRFVIAVINGLIIGTIFSSLVFKLWMCRK